MVNPQVEDGYTKIANEILEALSGINLSPYEARTLIFLIRKTFGWEKKTDWISLSQFSRGIALDRRHVFRALKGLEAKGLLVICRDDRFHPTYGFQKDYSKWKMADFHKSAVNDLNLKRKLNRSKKEEKEKAPVLMTPLSSLLAPTKETLTKATLKEREERTEQVNPFSLSKEETTPDAKTKEEEQRLHCWLVKEQAAYVKDHGLEGIENLDWQKYIRDYYPKEVSEDTR